MTSMQAAALWVGLNIILLVYLSFRVGAARTRGALEVVREALHEGGR